MPHKVDIQPSGHSFEVPDGETVLQAALDAGFHLPYGCRNGACGSCKGKVLSGEVALGKHSDHALSADEKAAGYTLFCSAKPLTDLVIEARTVGAVKDIVVKKLPCRVHRIEKPVEDVAILYLKLPANERLQFLAGQYIEFLLKDGSRRSFSMANAPHDDEFLQLHVRHVPGGGFTDHVFNAMKERDILRFEGPLGSFFLREESAKPIVFVASGTGFAPIKAVLESAFKKGVERPMTLYWGGRRPRDLYMDDLARSWAKDHANFRYVPVVSDALPEDGWTGRTGFVHRAVMEDFADLSGHQVYACGAPIVVESARRDYTHERGLPLDEFFADSFTTAADLATPAAG
ncbi:MAG: CDP-6-deoxy-delta-3,4-glucoseen reductase [Burkholderiales bacterium]|jgi:CDP-4-dehydro-6-deoxyglucose reductase|nr:CDP-6-deoxy-delta-3,4-glucoseen reductase [Burkholderiales bacterium]